MFATRFARVLPALAVLVALNAAPFAASAQQAGEAEGTVIFTANVNAACAFNGKVDGVLGLNAAAPFTTELSSTNAAVGSNPAGQSGQATFQCNTNTGRVKVTSVSANKPEILNSLSASISGAGQSNVQEITNIPGNQPVVIDVNAKAQNLVDGQARPIPAGSYTVAVVLTAAPQ